MKKSTLIPLFLIVVMGGYLLVSLGQSHSNREDNKLVEMDHSSEDSIAREEEKSRLEKKSMSEGEREEIDKSSLSKLSNESKEIELFNAIETNEIEKIEYLLSDSSIDLNVRDEQGNTLLLRAMDEGKLEIAKILLEKGANPLVENKRGLSVATAAALQFEAELFKDLVKKGAKANPSVLGKMNLLMNLSMEGQNELVSFIAEQKPEDVNLQDEFGNTALHYAVQGGHEQVVRELIHHQARNDIRNAQGDSPLDMAKNDGHTTVIKALLEN
ncbi:MAG: hypothetical protein CME60_00440 [Halobacteriovoraceae bacterium]|nr:hypothetical protein [Halobacteriovoraceae bacterium]|tara:strand:+ start:281 stop:1093 length:813 start_codon:yes stop_codon:yes gene_type:complete